MRLNYLTITTLFFSTLIATAATSATAKTPDIIDWSSEDGIIRLERSKHKVDFFLLANNFESQSNKLFCGPTSAVIVLNALRRGGEKVPQDQITFEKSYTEFLPDGFDPRFNAYTQNTFFSPAANKIKTKAQYCGQPIEGKADFGVQLRHFHQMLQSHGLHSQLRIVDNKADADSIKKEIIQNLQEKNDFVIVNYARKSLSQKGGGHISPLGAYDSKSNSFLVLDVNPNKAPWVWVNADDLISAMRTYDTVENRGYILVKE